MSRIVLTTIGSLGDLHPKIAIALELRRRGHDVVFATHQEYQATINALGFEFHVIATRLVAEKLGIPWVLTILQPLAFLSVYDASVLPGLPFLSKLGTFGTLANRGVRQLSKVMTQAWAEPIHQLRHELSLPPLVGNPFIDDKYSPYRVLAMFSSVFAKPQPDWSPITVLTGFAFYDGSAGGARLTPELEQFLDVGEPPVVFTLGSAAVMAPGAFYKESMQAAQRLNCRAVLLIGKNTPPDNLSDNIIAVSYAPYSQIFPRAGAVVHPGGIGTTAQVLRAGCPTLVMPYSHDQPDNAARVERLGTSQTIPHKQYVANRVARQLSELLDNPSYAAKAREIGTVIQAEDGVKIACNAIEQLASSSINTSE
ncbi:MAG: glycosyltransferase [Cyanothece sp. SIO1E1]|nr:glycosyltransferase [Cyanothece sp. SIO1E1]